MRGRNLKNAERKLERLVDRGARQRRITRASNRVIRLAAAIEYAAKRQQKR